MNDLLPNIRLLLPAVNLYELLSCGGEESDSTTRLPNYLIEKKLTKEQRINLLQQVSHCVLKLHQNDISHEKLSSTQISILKDPNYGALINQKPCGYEKKQDDIRSLADIYCCILTGGEKQKYSEIRTIEDIMYSDPRVALDILQKMTQQYPLTIDEVVQHPLHWSDFHKVHFICEAVECINREYKNKTEKAAVLEKYQMDNADNVIPTKGWIAELVLTKNELQRISNLRSQRIGNSRPPPVAKNLIQQKVKNMNEKLIYDLARFFRNRYIHFREDGEDVQSCFESYPSGYLKFYTRRFPNFFIHIYNNMKSLMCKNGFLGALAEQGTFSESFRNVQLCIKSNDATNSKNSSAQKLAAIYSSGSSNDETSISNDATSPNSSFQEEETTMSEPSTESPISVME